MNPIQVYGAITLEGSGTGCGSASSYLVFTHVEQRPTRCPAVRLYAAFDIRVLSGSSGGSVLEIWQHLQQQHVPELLRD